MKHSVPLLCAVLTVSPFLRADFVGVYDYLSSLGNVYAAQTGNEKWTFHVGDQNGALMVSNNPVGYIQSGDYAQFGYPAATGLSPSGSAGVNEAPGIFTHTAGSGFVSAVFHADSTFVAESILFTSELVNNGNQGNGIDLYLRTVVDGNVVDRGSFTINNVTSAQNAFNFGSSGLTFGIGDEIVVMFSARGSYLYDHGWWDIALQEVDSPTGGGNQVPDTGASTLMLMSLAIAGLFSTRRFRRLAA